jgi:hypothetical protein
VKNKNKHRCQSGDGLAPAGKFLGGSFDVSGTSPMARTISIVPCRSLWFVYLPGREIGTMQVLQPVMIS